jgi:hypothetical protein
MDARLEERLLLWHQHIEKLRDVERQYLELEAHEDVLFSELYLLVEKGSVAEREARVHANQEWKDFQKGLVAAKSAFNHERRILELKVKAYEAEYLERKLEAEAVQKWPRAAGS